MFLTVEIDTNSEDEQYIKASARIRHISKTELIRRLIEASIKDQIFGAILDDIKWEQDCGNKFECEHSLQPK